MSELPTSPICLEVTISIENRTDMTFHFRYVPTVFVERELRKLKCHKSTGIDNLPPDLLKDVAHEIAKTNIVIVHHQLVFTIWTGSDRVENGTSNTIT